MCLSYSPLLYFTLLNQAAKEDPEKLQRFDERLNRGSLFCFALICVFIQLGVMLCFDFSVTMPSCEEHSDCEFSGTFCHERWVR